MKHADFQVKNVCMLNTISHKFMLITQTVNHRNLIYL